MYLFHAILVRLLKNQLVGSTFLGVVGILFFLKMKPHRENFKSSVARTAKKLTF
jgi:hypothetical protein